MSHFEIGLVCVTDAFQPKAQEKVTGGGGGGEEAEEGKLDVVLPNLPNRQTWSFLYFLLG